jgi:hypothetical protein
MMALGLILFFPCSASAEKIDGQAGLVSKLSNAEVNVSESLKTVQKNLNAIKNEYLKKYTAQITWGDPAEFTQMGNTLLVISYQAIIASPARETALFSLLFEKQNNELNYKKSYLSWIGQTEIEGFDSLAVTSLCHLFENLTGESLCMAVDLEAKVVALDDKLQQQLSQTAPKAHTHNVGDITGIVPASAIDDAICRDTELAIAVSKLKKEIDKRPIPDPNVNVNAQLGVTTVNNTAALELANDNAGNAADSTDVEALKAQIAELQETVTQLAALLEGVSREGSDLIFSGMNLNVVSGSGATDATPNGLGNLIVGYNESANQNKIRINGGSHNLIIGKDQSYTSYGGFASGASNKISAPYATVTGGFNNSASGDYSSVSGGQLNTASGDYSTVGGGLTRKAEGNNNWRAGDQKSAK